MGFFTSRKADSIAGPESPVPRVVRSRFYGRSKGKPRGTPPDHSPLPSPLSDSPRPAHTRLHPAIAPSVNSHDTLSNSGTSDPSATLRPRATTASSQKSAARASTDVVTMTLAQRLGELAAANAEGLLNDDEYRLLRQSLFERFTHGTAPPSETPIVRLSAPPTVHNGRPSISSSTGRPMSNFHVDASRAPSLQSKSSVTTTMSGLFRRATGRRATSASSPTSPESDRTSVFSLSSSASNMLRHHTLPRALSRKGSETSFQTASPENGTFPSWKTGSSNRRTVADEPPGHPVTPSRSVRRMATTGPPSSFRAVGKEGRHPLNTPTDISEDGHLKTAKDIRREIELVEAEGRRLQDTFNGLELSTLTRRQRESNRLAPPLAVANLSPSRTRVAGSSHDHRSLHPGEEADATSMHSGVSRKTTLSAKMSSFSILKSRGSHGGPLVTQPVSLSRKGSMSSVSSRGQPTLSPKPSLPKISTSASSLGFGLGRLAGGSSSTVNLAKSNGHLPLPSVYEDSREEMRRPGLLYESAMHLDSPGRADNLHTPGDGADEEYDALETEMTEIRRRRAEVTARYDERLEYLRARLKGAEMHEKLLKK